MKTTVESKNHDPGELLPRRYQEEIFSRARQSNVIAALGTGSGKTFISILLMKWVASREPLRDKAIIFLVPKVTLVEQQGDFIAKHVPLRVLKLHGLLGVDMTDITGWRRKFERHDIFVMTAQIFLNLLTHSHWSISKVSLMVFDECHHTRKRHAFNCIMHEYFHTPSNRRPKIFGMTASPISDPDDPAASLATLEANLDAKVLAVQEHVEELSEYSTKPTEIIRKYPPSPESYDYLSPSLRKCLDLFYDWAALQVPWVNIQGRYFATYDNLGPYAAEMYLYWDIKRRLASMMTEPPKSYQDHGCQGVDRTQAGVIGSTQISPTILEIEAILSDFQPFFEQTPTAVPIPYSLEVEWYSPKVRVLVDILVECHTPTFQGIVFVEQRQVAACLAQILPCIPRIKGTISCAELIGHNASDDGLCNMRSTYRDDVVKRFREGNINLLIATSVAEEGLDFPACDVVVRFDSLRHIVGYVQSRGRARTKASTFVIMAQEDDTVNLARYQTFVKSEPLLKRIYQSRRDEIQDVDDPQNDEDEVDPADLVERKRFVIDSTGAIITYDNSIDLLNFLCSLIPCDAYTPARVLRFTGDFTVTLHLPSGLPLPPGNLVYTGPRKHTKKEARRAVAFLAVKALHALDVFDDHLLPKSGSKTGSDLDGDRHPISDVSHIPIMMDVLVRDPWGMGENLWLHPLSFDGRRTAGIVTGVLLPATELTCRTCVIEIQEGRLLVLDECEERRQLQMFAEFTKRGIWFCNATRPLAALPSLFLIPITSACEPDFETIDHLVSNPFGTFDWTDIGEQDYEHLMMVNTNEFDKPLLLRTIRYDLSPMSGPPPNSPEAAFPTYYEYFLDKYTSRRSKTWVARVPTDGPLVEVQRLARCATGEYSLNGISQECGADITPSINTFLIPQGSCRWVNLSGVMRSGFYALPTLCHRITDVYRVRQARIELGLPPIKDDLLVEAFTLPAASAGWNNQRLETLGDSVLKLCTTVHLYNKYPYRHEGQLSSMRQSCISNRTLLSRAKDIGLERFLTCEGQSHHSWRYVESDRGETVADSRPTRFVPRQFARRSLQDCMEATLGASFVDGGIPNALRTGTALALAFGGPHPWQLRYGRPQEPVPPTALFETLQDSLGYRFRNTGHLVEAVTHPSFTTSSLDPSYQRLEFLGDALLDLVVMKHLFDKFPDATSAQLSVMRSSATCASSLAAVAVKCLGLHNIMLINSVELNIEIGRYVPFLENVPIADVVGNWWRYATPKPLSDVLESVLGAVLIDSAYNYEMASSIVEVVMEDILAQLSPSVCMNPIPRLLEWMSAQGCTNVCFRKSASNPQSKRLDSITISVHGVDVVGPVIAGSLSVAKALASDQALAILKNVESDTCLSRLCDCGQVCRPNSDTAAVSVSQNGIEDSDEEEEYPLARIVHVEQPMVKNREGTVDAC